MALDPSAFAANRINFSPLLQAVQGYRQGMDSNFDFRGQQELGAALASGNMQGARDAAGKYGMDTNVLLTLGEKARQEQERARMAQALQGAESNPELGRILTPEVRASLAALPPEQRAARIAEYADPIKREQLNLQRQQAARAAADQYGKQGTVVQDKDGTYYSVQFGSNGQKIVAPLQFNGQGLTPSKGVDTVGDTIIDRATGAPVRNVAPNIAGAEQAKVEGREQGERAMGAPKAMAAMESAEAKSKLVLGKIDQALPMVSSWTTGMGSILANVPGTPARNLAEIKDTIVANLGFEELQDMRTNSPTGGALGAIAVQELAMLQKTKTSLEQAQSPPQMVKALNELKTFMAGSSERRRRAFEATYGQAKPMATQPKAPQANTPPPPNQEAVQMLRTNPALAPQFDEIFGKGAAGRVLGGQ